jgi:predicted nucleic acid-binding protein
LLSESERAELFDAFASTCEWISISFLWRPNLRDESDNHLVELAIAGNAACIVAANLRDLESGELAFPYLRITDPRSFLLDEG